MKTVNGGFLTAFEGGERSGKTTLTASIAVWLRELGYLVAQTREPGGSRTGQDIRRVLLDPTRDIDSRAEALLFAADRAHHVATVIRPAMEQGAIVLSDRYTASSIAYQGAGRGLGVTKIGELNRWATGGLVPHLTVLLDILPEVAALRPGHTRPDRIDREDLMFHDMVRRTFLELARLGEERYLTIDATLELDGIEELVRERILRELGFLAEDADPAAVTHVQHSLPYSHLAIKPVLWEP